MNRGLSCCYIIQEFRFSLKYLISATIVMYSFNRRDVKKNNYIFILKQQMKQLIFQTVR